MDKTIKISLILYKLLLFIILLFIPVIVVYKTNLIKNETLELYLSILYYVYLAKFYLFIIDVTTKLFTPERYTCFCKYNDNKSKLLIDIDRFEDYTNIFEKCEDGDILVIKVDDKSYNFKKHDDRLLELKYENQKLSYEEFKKFYDILSLYVEKQKGDI